MAVGRSAALAFIMARTPVPVDTISGGLPDPVLISDSMNPGKRVTAMGVRSKSALMPSASVATPAFCSPSTQPSGQPVPRAHRRDHDQMTGLPSTEGKDRRLALGQRGIHVGGQDLLVHVEDPGAHGTAPADPRVDDCPVDTAQGCSELRKDRENPPMVGDVELPDLDAQARVPGEQLGAQFDQPVDAPRTKREAASAGSVLTCQFRASPELAPVISTFLRPGRCPGKFMDDSLSGAAASYRLLAPPVKALR
jgi:hypothetical protein